MPSEYLKQQIAAYEAKADWLGLKKLIPQCHSWYDKVDIVMRLPGSEISIGAVEAIKSGENRDEVNGLLTTLIEKMKSTGWNISETQTEQKCAECKGTGLIWHHIDSPNENDACSYLCGVCDGKGSIHKNLFRCERFPRCVDIELCR